MEKGCLILPMSLVLAVGIAACRQPPRSGAERSKFIKEFELHDILSKVSSKEMTCDGLSSTNNSGGLLSKEYSTFRKQSAVDCQAVDSGAGIDQSVMMKILKTEVEQQIKSSGATVGDTGEDGSNFYCGYIDGNTYGWIEVISMTTDGGRYRFTYVIREVAKN